MGRPRIRLKDIADRTGFSTNTVSLALRESPRIPEETRQVIRNAAKALNYLPNQIAKSLVNRESKSIGLVLTEIRNPALMRTAQLLELALAERGYSMLLATSHNNINDEQAVIDVFRSRQVDGMLVYPASPNELDHFRPLRAANYPLVLLINDHAGGLDTVSMDDRLGAENATAHLIAAGHRRIGILDGSDPHRNRDKMVGYTRALAAAGIPFDPTICIDPGGPDSADGQNAMDRLLALPERPSAVYAVTDTLAFGAMKSAMAHGLNIPGDIAIMGHDNTEFCEYSAVPLSSMHYDAERISVQAVNRLMALIAAPGDLPAAESTLIASKLVVRRSTVANA